MFSAFLLISGKRSSLSSGHENLISLRTPTPRHCFNVAFDQIPSSICHFDSYFVLELNNLYSHCFSSSQKQLIFTCRFLNLPCGQPKKQVLYSVAVSHTQLASLSTGN